MYFLVYTILHFEYHQYIDFQKVYGNNLKDEFRVLIIIKTSKRMGLFFRSAKHANPV